MEGDNIYMNLFNQLREGEEGKKERRRGRKDKKNITRRGRKYHRNRLRTKFIRNDIIEEEREGKNEGI